MLLLFVVALQLLYAGFHYTYKTVTVPSDGESDAWYPAPPGGTVKRWADSYVKAAKLVEQMALVEKVNITTGTGWMMGPCVGNTGPVDRLGFPSLCLQDGPLGLRFVDNASSFPAGITIGATWNKDLMYQQGKAHGFEAKKKGVNVLLGPSMGPLGRLPAGGRNWEGFGSDPVLQAIGAVQTIKGIQENGVIATAKHLVGNEQEHFRQAWEWGTPNAISSNIDDRTLHELYAWPFAESVRAGVGSVMCSYNQVNNSYACQNSKLMNGILKDELGFQGFIQSDWLAQRSGVASALAGLDMSMPGDGLGWQDGISLWGGELTKAALNGSVPLDRLNDAVLRIVAAWYQLAQDDASAWPRHTLSSSATFSSWTDEAEGKLHPGSPGSEETGIVNSFVPVRVTDEGGDHDQLARKIATEGIVMVKNHDEVLPITPTGGNIKSTRHGKRSGERIKIGIFGEDAFAHPKGPNACADRGCNEFTLGSGWGSGASEFPYLVAPFDALNATFNHSTVEITAYKDQAAKHAGGIAEKQDLCIVFANSDAGEGFLSWHNVKGDRPNLNIQKQGDALIAEVAKKCGNEHQSQGSAANTIVVLHTVGPTILEHWIDLPGVNAVLIAHLPGEESGNALADIIFGKVNPSGKLPYTIAKYEDAYGPTSKILTTWNGLVPQQNFTEGLYIDYRYFDKQCIEPRYAFGYGQSYTKFQLSSPVVRVHATRNELPAARQPPEVAAPDVDDTIPHAKDSVFPKHLKKLDKYIYPYITSASDADPQGRPTFPYDPKSPHALSEAGGGEGGNPDLYTTLATVTATLTNIGNVTGSCVVQLYVALPRDSKDADGELVDLPVKVLRNFTKIEVPATTTADDKKAAKVEFEISRKDLSYWDVKRQNWVLPRGKFEAFLGFSSKLADLQSVRFNPYALAVGFQSQATHGQAADQCAPAITIDAKPQVFIMSDISNEPDDTMSFTRLLLHADQYNITGMAAVTSTWLNSSVFPEQILKITNAYGQVVNLLNKHSSGHFPSAEYLSSIVKSGQPVYGIAAIGRSTMSSGASHLIEVVDGLADDGSWLNVQGWGGANLLAEALAHVQSTRPQYEARKFYAKLRIYTISDQDNAGVWIRTNFPSIPYIVSIHGFNQYRLAAWAGMSGEKYYNFDVGGPDSSLVTQEFVKKNFQIGPLGSQYPDLAYIMEGDSPSLMHSMQNGLNGGPFDHPEWGGWGGRYILLDRSRQSMTYTDATDEVIGKNNQNFKSNQATIWRWRQAYQDEMSARIQWSVQANYSAGSHPPVVSVNGSCGSAPLILDVHSGQRIILDASGTYDPDANLTDRNDLQYKWFQYQDVTATQSNTDAEVPQLNFTISDDGLVAITVLPAVKEACATVSASQEANAGLGDLCQQYHVIFEVTGSGRTPITRYKRIVLQVQPPGRDNASARARTKRDEL